MHAKDTQLLTAATGDTLTATFAATSKTMRLESKSSVQFEALYVPHATTVGTPTDAKYVEMYIEWTNEKETQAIGGFTIPTDADWHPYKEEIDDGAGAGGSAGSPSTSTFAVRKFKIESTDNTTATNVDLSAIFTRPLFVNRVRLQIREAGVSPNFGKLIVRASAQAI